MESRQPDTLTLYLLSGGRERLIAALTLAATALALGRRVQLFLAWEALAAYAGGGLADAPWSPALAGKAQDPAGQVDPAAMLADLRRGGLKLYACSGSAQSLGLDEAALSECVDGISGTTAMLAMAGGGPILSF